MNSRSIQEEDPARLLGLSKNYDLGDVKSAYRKLALKYHPDEMVVKDRKHST